MADEGPQELLATAQLQLAPAAASQESSESSDMEDAAPRKSKRQERVWEEITSWDPTTEDIQVIHSELERIAREKMAISGITKLLHLKVLPSDLGMWKLKDMFESTESGSKVLRYRCPLSVRCKCPALLKVIHTTRSIRMLMSSMHGVESHAQDTSKYLKWHQKDEVVKHIQVHPMASAADIRRNFHRLSPEKKIAPEHVR